MHSGELNIHVQFLLTFNFLKMETVDVVLAKMKELNAPVNASTLAKETGLDKKEVDKAMAQLKKEEKIFSPVRCKWQAKE